MTNTRDLILEIKRVRDENGYSYADMGKLMEENGDNPLSPATFSRIFADGSENNKSFSYDYTLLPLARALLDTENIEEDDTSSVKALKEMLAIKKNRIKELEQQLDKEKIKRHEQLDELRAQTQKSIDFLREQITYKDARMNEFSTRITRLLDRLEAKDARIEKLTDDILALKDIKEQIETCPYRSEK